MGATIEHAMTRDSFKQRQHAATAPMAPRDGLYTAQSRGEPSEAQEKQIYHPMIHDSWPRLYFQFRVPGWPNKFTPELRILEAVKPNGDNSSIFRL